MTPAWVALTLFLLECLWYHWRHQDMTSVLSKVMKILWAKISLWKSCEKVLFSHPVKKWLPFTLKGKVLFSTACEQKTFRMIFTELLFLKPFVWQAFWIIDKIRIDNIVLFVYCQTLSTPELRRHTTNGSGRLTPKEIGWTNDSTNVSPSKDWAIVYCSAMWILQRTHLLSMTNCLLFQCCLNPWRGQAAWSWPTTASEEGFNLRRDRSHQQLWNWLKTSFSTVTGKEPLALFLIFLWDMFWVLQRIELLFIVFICVNPLKEQSTGLFFVFFNFWP